jgi:hypothetical protein
MTTGGNNSGNWEGPNRRGPDRRRGSKWEFIGKESLGLGVAEFASGITSLGTVAVLDRFAPDMVHSVSDVLAKVVFEPYLDHIENFMGKVCKLEDCQPDKSKPREERAKQLAYATMLFAPAYVTSLGAKLLTRKAMNKVFEVHERNIPDRQWWELWKMTRNEFAILALDESTHVGSLLVLNRSVAKQTDYLIRNTTSLFQGLGMSHDRAHRLANMIMIWELPNAIGFMFGVGGVIGKHHGWWDALGKKPPPGGHISP